MLADDLGLARLSAREASAAAILMAARSDGLFAAPDERRVVLVEDAGAVSDPAFLREVPADVPLVLLHEGALPAARGRGGSPLSAVVRELGGSAEEFRPLDEGEVERWLASRAVARGLSLATAAVRELARAIGADLERGEHELDKLAAYAGAASITAEDVRALVAGAIESDVFDLTNAVVRRDVRAAVRMLERVLDSGEPPQRLIGLLVWQFRALLVASGARTERDLERAARETGLSPVALQRARRYAGLRPAEAARAYETLYEVDLAIKSGRADARTALQLAVLDLCGVAEADVRGLAERRG